MHPGHSCRRAKDRSHPGARLKVVTVHSRVTRAETERANRHDPRAKAASNKGRPANRGPSAAHPQKTKKKNDKQIAKG